MHNLLAVTAAVEVATGVALIARPSGVVTLLLGSSLDAPASLTLARVAGIALIALGVACWLARGDGQSRAARGIVGAMVFYNTGVAIVLAWAGIGLALSGMALWPAAAFHAAMTAWCISTLR
jgi:hypothetical protein